MFPLNQVELKITIHSRLTTIESNTWSHVFPVANAEVTELLAATTDRRVICTLAGGHHWNCALLAAGDGNWFINVSKNVQKAGQLAPEQAVTFTLEPDESEYGMPVPEELIELWAVDESYQTIFHKLTPGRQRSLLYRIGQPKTSTTRAKRAVQIMEYLRQTNGALDYKELAQFIKNWSEDF